MYAKGPRHLTRDVIYIILDSWRNLVCAVLAMVPPWLVRTSEGGANCSSSRPTFANTSIHRGLRFSIEVNRLHSFFECMRLPDRRHTGGYAATRRFGWILRAPWAWLGALL